MRELGWGWGGVTVKGRGIGKCREEGIRNKEAGYGMREAKRETHYRKKRKMEENKVKQHCVLLFVASYQEQILAYFS